MENTFDFVENRIKIETRFRLDVTDYINKMYKTRENSILPYDINTEDVFEMLQDLTWTSDDKFVVFFNFEFVMCLMKLGVTPNRITYIAPSKESFYVVRDGGWGERGMKSILFDSSIYKRYKNRKQWKKHLMKKIGKLDEFIGVGNIPFTQKSGTSTNTKKIGNDFIKLMNQFKKSCYILPGKFDSPTFLNELITNPNLVKITFHKKQIFDIHEGIKTCTVLLDSSNNTDEFIYTDNISNLAVTLKKSKNLVLSRNFNESFIKDTSQFTIGDLWTRGKVDLNKISKSGKYKVITSVGSYKEDTFSFEYDETETTSIGKWKVIVPNVGGGVAVKIAGPEYAISHSVVGFCVDTEEQARKLYNFIIDNDIMRKSISLATSNANTKTLFSKIPLPDGII
jgi:hypothetical protein